jgi:predicted acylesterase/phospholipase RssA
LSSASVPFAFPPTKLREWNLMDGGTTWNINIIGAIEECRKLVEKDSDIILDIVLLIPD